MTSASRSAPRATRPRDRAAAADRARRPDGRSRCRIAVDGPGGSTAPSASRAARARSRPTRSSCSASSSPRRRRAAAEILGHHALREQAIRDSLTGLGNRRKLAADLDALVARDAARRRALLMLFDLNGFKGYNDTFGHPAGDALLARLGAKLSATRRAVRRGLPARRRRVLRRAATSTPSTSRRSSRSPAAALTRGGEEFAISASYGVVAAARTRPTASSTALQLADERMYAHKHGRALGRARPGARRADAHHAGQAARRSHEHSSQRRRARRRRRPPARA